MFSSWGCKSNKVPSAAKIQKPTIPQDDPRQLGCSFPQISGTFRSLLKQVCPFPGFEENYLSFFWHFSCQGFVKFVSQRLGISFLELRYFD